VYSAVGSAVRSAVGSAVDSAVDSAVRSAVYSAVGSAVDSAVDSAVRSAVYSAVGSAVRSAVGSAVDSAVGSAVDSAVGSAGRSFVGGSLWSGYPAWADYFNEVLGISIDRNYLDMAENCGYYWLLDDVCFASERPKKISLDDQGRLHSETGLSIEYPSGWGIFHWHGTKVPGEWIMQKEKLTAKIALTWENIEQRRSACEILTWAKVLDELKAKVLNTDDDEEIGELVEVEIPDIGKEKFLRVICGTGRKFAIPMPPHIKTALEGNAWSYGIDGDTLKKLEVRT
jgi:phage baseplate assembly protein W